MKYKNEPKPLQVLNQPIYPVVPLLNEALKPQADMKKGDIKVTHTTSKNRNLGVCFKVGISEIGVEVGINSNQLLSETTSIEITKR